MPDKSATPTCPKCGKPVRLRLTKTGDRKLQCIDCEGDDPMMSRDVTELLKGELRSPE
jgi:hypothetical protein